MSYNEKEDKVIREIEVNIEAGNILIGKVMQYGTSPKKIQITRKIAGKYGWQFNKLGRITKEELPLIRKLLDDLEGDL